jgi:hypothetical protein
LVRGDLDPLVDEVPARREEDIRPATVVGRGELQEFMREVLGVVDVVVVA